MQIAHDALKQRNNRRRTGQIQSNDGSGRAKTRPPDRQRFSFIKRWEKALLVFSWYDLMFAAPAIAMVVTAFTDWAPVNPGANGFLLWTPLEAAIWSFALMIAIIIRSAIVARTARVRLVEAERNEDLRRAISAIGVAANWDLDLERLYRRVSQDLKSVIQFDRLTITSAQTDGRMRVEFVSGSAEHGLGMGEFLPTRSEHADGLSPSSIGSYRSRLTVPIAACNGTLTIRSSRKNAYTTDELDLLRQAVAQISPGISNAINYQTSQRQVKERTALASIGRAANSQLELRKIFRTVETALKDLIPFDHVGVILSNKESDDHTVAYWSNNGLLNRWQGDSISIDLKGARQGEMAVSRGTDPLGLGQNLERGPLELRTWLETPLVVHETAIGLLILSSPGAIGFTEEESALLKNVSLQIAPAIQNAVLNTDLTRLAEERKAIAAIGLAANNDMELETVYEHVAQELAKVVRYDRLTVVHKEAATDEHRIAYVQGLKVEGRGTGTVDELSYLYADADRAGHKGVTRIKHVPPALNAVGLKTFIRVSLGSEHSYIGSLNILSKEPSAFDDHTIEFLERVAQQISPAIRNAHMLAAERELRATLDRQNQELQEATNARKEFLSSISHELKTPLTIIAGFIDLLSSDTGDMEPAERKETLDIIRRNANHLDVLINDILDISRLDAGTFKILPGAFNASELMRDIESSFISVLTQKDQTLLLDVPKEDIWVNADRTRISQVITNLVSNASKYSPENTEIEVTCEVEGDRLHLSVRDHGIGIPDEQKESLFTPFFRVDNETTRKVSGTGLGLVIAKSIVEIHEGEINLKSEPDEGTTIEFWLPGLTSEEQADVSAEEISFSGSRLWADEDMDEFGESAD